MDLELLKWCRENGVAMIKTPDGEVHFSPPPLVSVVPAPAIANADKMTPSELKTAMDEAARERLMFRSS